MTKFVADSTIMVPSGKGYNGTSNNTQYNNTQDMMRLRDYQESKTLVIDDPNLSHGFTQIPNIILRDGRLTDADKILYGLLLSYAWQSKECFPGIDKLCEVMGCDKRKVNRTLKHLKEMKLIMVERRGLGKTNIYHIRKFSDGYLKQYVDRGANG